MGVLEHYIIVVDRAQFFSDCQRANATLQPVQELQSKQTTEKALYNGALVLEAL